MAQYRQSANGPVMGQIANNPQTEVEVNAVRTCIRKGLPFGDDLWVKRNAVRLDLESTLRRTGRSRKRPAPNGTVDYRKTFPSFPSSAWERLSPKLRFVACQTTRSADGSRCLGASGSSRFCRRARRSRASGICGPKRSLGPRSSEGDNHANSAETASALTSSRGWFRWL